MTPEEITQRWPEWKIWKSANGGLVCATRHRSLSLAEIGAGLAQTLVEGDMPTLIECLSEQDERERALCQTKA